MLAKRAASWATRAISFHRFQQLVEQSGELALQERSWRKPIPKNRAEPAIEEPVLALALEKPAYGQVRVANELTKRGLFMSPGTVRLVWLRHEQETLRKRLKGLEGKVAGVSTMLCKRRF